MTLTEVYREALAGTQEPAGGTLAFDLSCLLERCLGVQRFALPLHGGDGADPAGTALFFALAARYAAGEPLQYLLGEWEFYGLPFYVGPGVLIPRPDTETLVERARIRLEPLPSPAVADLCAGSGCVGIALARCQPAATVWAVEFSEAAFGYLERNIARNRVSVRALLADVFDPTLPLAELDCIVCNPPYITQAEMGELQPQVRLEPEHALCGGTDGLDFYRRLPGLMAPRLRPGGWLLFEVGQGQAAAVEGLLKDAGYTDVVISRDLSGIRRVVEGRRPMERKFPPEE